MKTPNQALGAWGEAQAAAYLRSRGYIILDRNVRTPYGEIDLVARQFLTAINELNSREEEELSMLVFIEVKTRRTKAFGYPEQSIDQRKREHILASAQSYLQEHPELVEDWRVDVIAIQRFHSNRPPEIVHFENVFS
jgi:putative endonuclease